MPSIFICKVYFYQIQPWKNVEICGNEAFIHSRMELLVETDMVDTFE